MIGYIGLGLLLIAYVTLLTKYSKWFIPLDVVASALLTVHAVAIVDVPFMIVNGFITVILAIKFLKKETI